MKGTKEKSICIKYIKLDPIWNSTLVKILTCWEQGKPLRQRRVQMQMDIKEYAGPQVSLGRYGKKNPRESD